MVKIIADSCSDLSPELIEKYQIGIVPLDVLIGDTNYKDGVNLSTRQLFELVEKTGVLPKTSAPSFAAFQEAFSHPGEIVYISISSMLSATYQSAVLVRETLKRDDIHIIDSLNLSTGIGLLVITAAELSAKGLNAAQIVAEINQLVSKVHSSFVIDTLEYIYKGGRCSAIEMLVGGILKIRPVIEVRGDGTLGVKRKVNGTRKKALLSMVDDFSRDIAALEKRRVFITHTLTDEAAADAHFLKTEIEKHVNVDEILFTTAGATIASHCGPETIGILYLTK
jgi:DegV family protein with EDD domain